MNNEYLRNKLIVLVLSVLIPYSLYGEELKKQNKSPEGTTSFVDSINVETFTDSIDVTLEDKLEGSRVETVLEEANKWVYRKKPFYDPSYMVITYPSGDIPDSIGVCTDLIIRSFRVIGIDFQKDVHDYLNSNNNKNDVNIDHRRCTNLIEYLDNSNLFLRLDPKESYKKGDLIFWVLDNGKNHVGIVSDKKGKKNNLVLHHLYENPSEDDSLDSWKIIRHYRLAE